MSFEVRLVRPEDVAQIVSWTSDTFEWGDYVPDRLPTWIEDPDSAVVVCVDETAGPVAVVHALMLSGTEGWLEAARVHPDHKRSGMGSALNEAGVAWTKDRGARVVRLATEAINSAARGQVEALGYRHTSSWMYTMFDIDSSSPQGNGPGLKAAPKSDIDAAWMFWSTSELAHRGRGLLAHGWQWRKATPDDLVKAAEEGAFLQSPAGWVVADSPVAHRMRAPWIATTAEEAPQLLADLIEHARERKVSELSIKMPNIPWVKEALTRAGGNPKETFVYSLAV